MSSPKALCLLDASVFLESVVRGATRAEDSFGRDNGYHPRKNMILFFGTGEISFISMPETPIQSLTSRVDCHICDDIPISVVYGCLLADATKSTNTYIAKLPKICLFLR